MRPPLSRRSFLSVRAWGATRYTANACSGDRQWLAGGGLGAERDCATTEQASTFPLRQLSSCRCFSHIPLLRPPLTMASLASKMPYNNLGPSGLRVSKLSCACATAAAAVAMGTLHVAASVFCSASHRRPFSSPLSLLHCGINRRRVGDVWHSGKRARRGEGSGRHSGRRRRRRRGQTTKVSSLSRLSLSLSLFSSLLLSSVLLLLL